MIKFIKIPLLILISFTNSSCSNQNVFNQKNIDTNGCKELSEKKEIFDINNEYVVNTPTHWKRSFFVDENSSVLTFADTTKQLDQAYVLEVGFYKGHLKMDENKSADWIKKLIVDNKAELIQNQNFEFKGLKSIALHYQFKFYNLETNKYETYIKYDRNSYYRLSLTMYGKENKLERLCTASQILESFKIKPE